VTNDGHPVHLTPTEFDLLVMLAQNPGRVLTHRQILLKVWGPAHGEDVPYLRVFIGQLRQKIERNPNKPEYIRTEPGIGYRWMPVD
jgi:two-component system, OmpR family, KDP operon response regulator KdpE